MEKERNERTNMGAISQTIKSVWSALSDMVNSEDTESIDEAIASLNKENPVEAKNNDKIAKALEYQMQSAKEREERVMDVTLPLDDEKLGYLKVEAQKVGSKKMMKTQKTYEQATKEEKQKE